MSEPNPYEPPRALEPLTTGKVVKRSVGIGLVFLVTPVAACIAGFVSCLTHDAVPPIGDPAIYLLVRPIVAALPLLATLAGVSYWAICMHRGKTLSPRRWSRFDAIMTLMPFAVVAALGVGYVATGLFVDAISELGTAILVGSTTFFGPPVLALIGMLWLAWRVR
jgi:hypothetical protein